ncbi:MAG: hypothetical protein IPG38_11935 [Chitinophagaceae bacterium]|nr:hypothetical protein [Chitinophagaceae bacterium]
MRAVFINISLYWKCQLIGWAIFLVVVTGFNELVYHDTNEFLPFAISIYGFGFYFPI